jgi:hypothetical protein
MHWKVKDDEQPIPNARNRGEKKKERERSIRRKNFRGGTLELENVSVWMGKERISQGR